MKRVGEPSRLNPDLMNPKRVLIVTILYIFGPRTVGQLAKTLGLSWGDVDSNIRRLREKGYVEVRKLPTPLGPRTFVRLTPKGVEEYRRLVKELREILEVLR